MKLLQMLALVWLLHAESRAWHFPVHVQITHNAVESLPPAMRRRWSGIEDRLEREYSLYPDRIQGAGEPEFSAMAIFCVKPDGKPIHNITWEPEDDLRSLAFNLHGMIDSLRVGQSEAAAKHAGVLAHFLEDSTCPAHALIPADSPLESMRQRFAPPAMSELGLHPAIERSAPAFDLTGRAPRQAGSSVDRASENLLQRCYLIVRGNRDKLESLVKAVYAGDARTVDAIRLEAARRGAELVADAYYTAFLLAGENTR